MITITLGSYQEYATSSPVTLVSRLMENNRDFYIKKGQWNCLWYSWRTWCWSERTYIYHFSPPPQRMLIVTPRVCCPTAQNTAMINPLLPFFWNIGTKEMVLGSLNASESPIQILCWSCVINLKYSLGSIFIGYNVFCPTY